MLFHFDPDPGPECPDIVRAIVEIPKESSNKYEYDPTLGLFKLSRTLYSPMHYPGDYGFIPGTIAEDRDPLDVLVLVASPSFTGCLFYVRPIGVLEMLDSGEHDDKILAVPVHDPRQNEVRSVDDVSSHVRREIEYFFHIYKELENKVTKIIGWHGPGPAHKVILESRARYLAAQPAVDVAAG
ncbi:MAG: inorganic diphosphatase [Bryobacteraceae bacterium]